MLHNALQLGDNGGALLLHGLGIAPQAAVIGLGQALPAGGLVEPHDRGQQDGVGHAVGDVVLAAQRIAQGVDGGGAGGGDGHAGIEAGDLHLVLGVHGLGIVAGALDVVQDHVQSLHGEDVAEGVGLVGGPALDGVGQGVHAGGGGDLPGQLLNHDGVQDDVVGDHVGVHDAHLQLLLRHSHDGVGSGFGAGAGGGGDHQGLDALLGAAGLVQQLLDTVLVGHQDGGQLGGVLHAAAADGHDEVGAVRLALVHQLLGLHVGGLSRQVVQNGILHAGLLDLGHGQVQQARALDALVAEHGQALHAVLREDVLNLLQSILAAEYCVRHFQIVLRQHICSSLLFFGAHQRGQPAEQVRLSEATGF